MNAKIRLINQTLIPHRVSTTTNLYESANTQPHTNGACSPGGKSDLVQSSRSAVKTDGNQRSAITQWARAGHAVSMAIQPGSTILYTSARKSAFAQSACCGGDAGIHRAQFSNVPGETKMFNADSSIIFGQPIQ